MERTYGVSAAERELVVRLIRSLLPNARILAFGSRVRGEAKRYSDLDLAIDAGAPVSFERLAQLGERFAESELPYKIDLIDLNGVTDDFRGHVLATAAAW